jgi:RNA recognition motif-containing protein
MADRKLAQKVIDELNGAEFDGRRIVVNIATER